MIDRFNMVSMDGIDIVKSQGVEVEGLYNKLLEGIAVCRYQILYNWYFANIVIPPATVELVNDGDSISINGFISIDSNDIVHVYSLERPPVINPISISQNGEYSVPDGVDGYNPVQVNVESPQPTLIPLRATENRTYSPSGFNADGFSSVTVEVNPSEKEAIHIWTHSTGGNDASIYVQEGILSGTTFSPTSEVYDVLYTTVQSSTGRDFNIVNIKYGPWTITALDTVIYNLVEFLPGAVVTTWQYNTSINYILYKGE